MAGIRLVAGDKAKMKPDIAVQPDGALATIKRKLESTNGGQNIQENVKRHYENLEKLAANLRKLGMDEREISDEILQVFRQYERVLGEYLHAA